MSSKVGEKSPKLSLRGSISLEELSKLSDKPYFSSNLVTEILKRLTGKVLTIIDASITEPKQNKAIKDLIRNKFFIELARLTEIISQGRVLGITIEQAKTAEEVDEKKIID